MNFYERVGTEIRGRRRRYHDDQEPIQLRKSESHSGEKRWAAQHDVFWGATQTYDRLPPGLYRCGHVDGVGTVLLRQTITVDDLIDLQDDNVSSILAEFERFWSRGREFELRGFLKKRGFLFYGGPGSGKTALVNMLIQKLIDDHNGIVLFLDCPRHPQGFAWSGRLNPPGR